jgi:DNA-binding MarR family transcriptional regulator
MHAIRCSGDVRDRGARRPLPGLAIDYHAWIDTQRRVGRSIEHTEVGVVDLAELFNQLVRFETELWNAVDARLRAEFDLPLTRFEPMQVIKRLASCRVYDIATELSITIGGTSKLVDRIEAAGHCRRVANPHDRRSSLIELTPAGRRMLVKATAIFEEELQTRIGSAVSARQLDQFQTVLGKMRANNALVEGARTNA